MKLLRITLCLFLCIIAAVGYAAVCYAQNGTTDTTDNILSVPHEWYSESAGTDIWNNCNFTAVKNPSETPGEIQSFDVRNDGFIAVAFEDGLICVYDRDFKLIHAMTFKIGGLYAVQWVDRQLMYIEARGAFAILFNDNYSFERACRFTDRTQFSRHFKLISPPDSLNFNGDVYTLRWTKAKGCDAAQQQLIRTDTQNRSVLLYSTQHIKNYFPSISASIALLIICGAYLLWRKSRKQNSASAQYQ